MIAFRLALAAAAVVLGVIGYGLLRSDLHQPVANSLASVAIAWTFFLAGLVAWTKRPENRLGWLLTATGFALLVRQLQYSHDAGPFTFGFLLGELNLALFAHAALAYPSGRVRDRWERALLSVGYPLVVLGPLAMLLVFDADRSRIFDPFPRESLIAVYQHDGAFRALRDAYVVVVYGLLAAAFVALLVRKLVRATPRARRILTPLVLAALVASLRAVYEGLLTFFDPSPGLRDQLFWWQVAGQLGLPAAFLVGLLRARLATATVAKLVIELEQAPPEGLRDALARSLGDPSLELAFWLPERRAYVDESGRAVDLREEDPRRAVTTLRNDREPIAAIVHDPTLLDEPGLVQAAGAAARLALENARLQAELRAQLAKVEESRARIVAAGDEQRRRIERDLHDGAQQRLVALALELRIAQRRLGTEADPEVERVLAAAVDELQAAVGELRELAHGVHPSVLAEDGLAAGLESLVRRVPLKVSLEAPEGRLPREVEATAYFVACEALANVVKHARATTAEVRAEKRDGRLVIEVADDGVGGAVLDGSGLRGLVDRVEAHGGRLRVESPRGGGTRVVGEIPCGS